MTTVAKVRALGDGGLQDPQSGAYISSKRDTIIQYTPWVENLVNHDKVALVEVLDDGNYTEYQNFVTNAAGDEEKAYDAYKATLPRANPKAEKVTVVETAADVDKAPRGRPAKVAAPTGDATE